MTKRSHAPGTAAADAAARVRALGRRADPAPRGISLREIEEIQEAVQGHREWVEPLREAMAAAVIGRKRLADRLLVALMTGGHVLVEGGPGLAKTLALRTLATATGTSLQTLRLTPDMTVDDVPGDPAGATMLLAYDLDQAPAKVQSALLEIMRVQRRAAAAGNGSVEASFLLVATQNPLGRAAVTPLPEALTDHFLLNVALDFPSPAEERAIIDLALESARGEMPVVAPERLRAARAVADTVYVDARIKDYVVTLVHATRDPRHYGLDLDRYLRRGASSRATLDLVAASRAVAFLRGRAYVRPDDVQAIWPDVMRHRIGLTAAAAVEGVTSADVAAAIRDGIAAP